MIARPHPASSLLAIALLFATSATRASELSPGHDPALTYATAQDVQLAPGEFEWNPELAAAGPVLVVVSIDDQIAYVYRNGVRIGTTTVSTGRPGNETPTGVFQILQKKKMHYSNLYDDAPMPFMQRLTWDGVAMHAGRIPGRPASHGCVRLPAKFAPLLYSVTYHGGTVVVTDAASPATLDLATLPADMAQLVFAHRDGGRATAVPGSVAVDTIDAGVGVGMGRMGQSD